MNSEPQRPRRDRLVVADQEAADGVLFFGANAAEAHHQQAERRIEGDGENRRHHHAQRLGVRER
jgi:hypothetical protein